MSKLKTNNMKRIDISTAELESELITRGYIHLVRKPKEAWQTDSLFDLLVDRYNVSRHTTIEKMLDLVKAELSI